VACPAGKADQRRRSRVNGPDRDKPVLHLICNAHLDPVWQWRWEEGLAEALSTFRTAVDLLSSDPDLIFNHNEAVLYDWIRTHDPGLFREIGKLVESGRWSVAGGWYLQPDVNLPGTESLFRQILYGRRFFSEHFGKEPQVAYNFDSFGHSAGLPQILLQTGFEMYIHMRPRSSEMALPADLYRWRGADGSTILTYRLNIGLYHTEYGNLADRIGEGVEKTLKSGHDEALFWGIGDHGGGATREDLSVIREFIKSERRIVLRHSTTEEFFRALRPKEKSAPIHCGGLQPVFTGCYTSLARVKRRSQQNLGLLRQSEALAAAAWFMEGADFPGEEFDEAWKAHLFNDFHDILPGTCTEPAEKDALDLFGHSGHIARKIRLKSMVHLAGGREPAYLPLSVAHAQPGLTGLPVEVECMIAHRPKWSGAWHLRLWKDRREIPCQEEQADALLPFNQWRRKVVFMAALPPLGISNYTLTLEKGKAPARQALSPFDINVSPVTGIIQSLSEEKGDCPTFGPLPRFLVLRDEGDSWGTGIPAYRDVEGALAFEAGSLRVLRTGPVRTVTESRFFFRSSSLVLQILHYHHWPVVELRLRIHWAEEAKRLKVSIPAPLAEARLTAEVPGAAVRIPPDGREHVHGRWFLISGKSGRREYAVGAAHAAAPGLDFFDGEARLSLLRSAAYCHEKGFNPADGPSLQRMDMGVNHFRLALTLGSPSEVAALLPALSDWLSAPPFPLAHLPAATSSTKSLFSAFPANIRLLSCRRSGQGDALLIRLQEASGLETEFDLRCPPADTKARIRLRPYEIRLFRLDKKGISETHGLDD
jgi:alpha-mannosidase